MKLHHISDASIMIGSTLPLVLLGFGASTLGAPTLVRDSDHQTTAPPGCIGWVWEYAKVCIVSPPTTTIGPSTRRDESEAFTKRDADMSYPTRCIPLILQEWNLCVLAPPTTTIAPSTKQIDPNTPLKGSGDTPTPTSDDGCIPIILEIWNICIVAPPTTTIVPSTKKTKRDWFDWGPPTVGGLNPDKTTPGGPLIPDDYTPGGSLVPDVPVPGGSITPST